MRQCDHNSASFQDIREFLDRSVKYVVTDKPVKDWPTTARIRYEQRAERRQKVKELRHQVAEQEKREQEQNEKDQANAEVQEDSRPPEEKQEQKVAAKPETSADIFVS